MSTNAHLGGRPVRTAVLAIALAALGLGGGVAAQSGGAAPPGDRPELQQLKERVERRFQVLVIRQGLVLVPKTQLRRAASIELSETAVLVDGTPVTGPELRDRVGADADLVVQLSFLDAAVRRQLFETSVAKTPGEEVSPGRAPLSVTTWSDDSTSGRGRSRYGGARVRIGNDIRIREAEDVGSDVVVIFGHAYVDGSVNGDVVSVLGGVTLGPKAEVRGDVTSVGGSIDRSTGAKVSGQINEVNISVPSVRPYVHFRPWTDWSWFRSPFGAPVQLVGTLVRIGVIGLLAALVVTVLPGKVQRVSDRVAAEPWRAALTGLAAQLLFVPLLVLTVLVLAVSIIGIPLLLLVPFVVVTALLALLLGVTGVGCAIGQRISRARSGDLRQLFVPVAVGLAVIWGLTVIARLVGLAGTPFQIVTGGVLLVGFVIEYVAWTVGLGGVLLSRFGRRT